MDLLKNRDGLMLGICNGFQALIKLGLVPYGEIIDTDASCPTLTFNTIGRHQSRLVRTRIASNRSPWLAGTQVGDGRFGQVIKPQVVVAPRPRDACEAVIEKRQLLVVGIPGRIGLE